MKICVNRAEKLGRYIDPTRWQNSTLRYSPPEKFPAYMSGQIGRAEIMRTWITLDEYFDYRTGTFYPDYDIGVARYPVEELHYPYDWKNIVPAPSGTRFKAYLTSHAKEADELLLNVRRFEREVSDGVITYDEYESIFENAVEYCKKLAPNIRYIECCNEVDIRSFGNLTAEEYSKIYLCAYRAVRRLNEKHSYDIPLELGGFAAAHPIACWDMMREVVERLKAAGVEMDFYSYHHYETSSTIGLVKKHKLDIAGLSAVGKIRRLLSIHNEMLADFGLPKKKIFLNELGRSRTTGIDGDALYNAAGIITYLLAFGCSDDPDIYPFPWCTFHNPELQISFTQFLLCEDGSFAMTPNGVAVKMLHDLSGERLGVTVKDAYARDSEYCAVAVEEDNVIDILIANPSGETVACELEVAGMPAGDYVLTRYLCDSHFNNCVTAKNCDGKSIEKTADVIRKVGETGVFKHYFVLEKDAFTLYRIEKQ